MIARGGVGIVPTVDEYAAQTLKNRQAEQAIKESQQVQQENALKLAQAQRADRDAQIMADAMRSTPDGDWVKIRTSAIRGGASPASIMKLDEGIVAHQKALADVDKLNEDARKARLESDLSSHAQGAEAIQALLSAKPEEQAQMWSTVTRPQLQKYFPEQAALFSEQMPGTGQLGMLHQFGLTEANRLKNLREQAGIDLSRAQEKETGARTEHEQAQTTGTNIANQNAQIAQDAAMLADAMRQGNFTYALGQLPPARAERFVNVKSEDDLNRMGMTAQQRVEADQKAADAAETKRLHDMENQIAKGNLSVAQARETRENKEFQAKYGNADSRSAFTQAVLENPDSYFSLPPELKIGVATDLAAQGKPVPTQLPSDLKNRAVSAGVSLAAIQRVRDLLQDPDLAGATGPWQGLKGNFEQKIGDTFFKDAVRASKEQQLRTELANLKFSESKGIFGGRPASQLIEALSNVTASQKMSDPLIQGALASMENNLKQIGNEAGAYSWGGAGGAARGSSGSAATPHYSDAQWKAYADQYFGGDVTKAKAANGVK